ncbi:hypothetical protein [Mycoplasma sp. P36-A1]|uniref:hypothetical protein n=1 Tax=Mycoplasma sp. P36-A1 TaxID=3252900 RepID=UPI003C30E5F7
MTNKMSIETIEENYLKTLNVFVPVVSRVHGANHPEFFEVKKIYEKMVEKLEANGFNDKSLKDDFLKLREITTNYTIPSDVCESFEKVYYLLSELDKEYELQNE